MKKLISLTLFCATLSFTFAQGIDFFQGKWDEALKLAQEQNKLVFVDAYTTWCGPCKRMSAQVFPQKEVGDYYNAHFINMKLDMERGEGLEFRKKYPVSAFPTFFWIDGDGQVVHTTKGARQVKDFIELGKTAFGKYDGSAKFKVQYDEGARDYETVYNYVVALNKAGKSSLKVVNDYLKEQTDLTTPENLRLILVGAHQVDSKIFGYLEEHKAALIGLEGEDTVNKQIRAAANETVQRAAKYESADLLEEAVAAVRKHLPDEAGQFEAESGMTYAKGVRDADMYYGYTKTYLKKYAGDRAGKLHGIAVTIMKQFASHPELLKLGEDAARRSVEVRSTDKRLVTYATLVYLNGDKNRAVKIVDDAIEAAQAEDRQSRELIMLKRRFSAS
ncbi:MAG: thioredoxin family protein [Saprospiraceae bacterium]|nr:thioredoxin family protein [Saprospiraceae bacterium]